jgi:hypothetical protein
MKYTTNRRANTKTIANLKNNEGLTFRYGKVVEYKTGWQVAFAGVEVKTAQEVSDILHSPMGRKGYMGVWFSEGVYYVDFSRRVNTKSEALRIGKACNQQSIYGWAPRKKGQLVWCENE